MSDKQGPKPECPKPKDPESEGSDPVHHEPEDLESEDFYDENEEEDPATKYLNSNEELDKKGYLAYLKKCLHNMERDLGFAEQTALNEDYLVASAFRQYCEVCRDFKNSGVEYGPAYDKWSHLMFMRWKEYNNLKYQADIAHWEAFHLAHAYGDLLDLIDDTEDPNLVSEIKEVNEFIEGEINSDSLEELYQLHGNSDFPTTEDILEFSQEELDILHEMMSQEKKMSTSNTHEEKVPTPNTPEEKVPAPNTQEEKVPAPNTPEEKVPVHVHEVDGNLVKKSETPKQSQHLQTFADFKQLNKVGQSNMGDIFEMLRSKVSGDRHEIIDELNKILEYQIPPMYDIHKVSDNVSGTIFLCTSLAIHEGSDGIKTPYLNVARANIVVANPSNAQHVDWNLVARAYIEHFNDPRSHCLCLRASCTHTKEGQSCVMQHFDDLLVGDERNNAWNLMPKPQTNRHLTISQQSSGVRHSLPVHYTSASSGLSTSLNDFPALGIPANSSSKKNKTGVKKCKDQHPTNEQKVPDVPVGISKNSSRSGSFPWDRTKAASPPAALMPAAKPAKPSSLRACKSIPTTDDKENHAVNGSQKASSSLDTRF